VKPRLHLARAIARLAATLPRALEALHLQWALREIDPLHPDVPWIVHRLRELEGGR
jgi:hypothetical protein